MVSLGFEPGAAEWFVQTDPLSYGGLHYLPWSSYFGPKWLTVVFKKYENNLNSSE